MDQIGVRTAATFDQWVQAYRTLAESYVKDIDLHQAGAQKELVAKLNHDCQVLIANRKQFLRESEDYLLNKISTTIAGVVPFGKAFMSRGLGKDFARTTLKTFGLGDGEKLRQFQKNFQGKFNSKTKMALSIAGTGCEEVATEILHHAAAEGGSEAVHAKPIIGQAISMGMGYFNMRKKMLGMINLAGDKAALLHRGLVIPHIVQSLIPTVQQTRQSSNKKSGAVVHVEEILPECTSLTPEQKPRTLMGHVPHCWHCERRLGNDETAWLMTWEEHKYGMTTICNKCKGTIETLEVKDYKRLFAFVTVTRRESFEVEWACMVDGCPMMEIQEGSIDGVEFQYICSSCGYVRCPACLQGDDSNTCPSCSRSHSSLRSPLQRAVAPEIARAAERPLLVCSHCDDIQSQAGAFSLCEACLAHGKRAIYCLGCTVFGFAEDHLEQCKYSSPPPVMRKTLAVPQIRVYKGSEYTCDVCRLVYDWAVPYASNWDGEHHICYICYFKSDTDMRPYRGEDGAADFQLYLGDKPQAQDPRATHKDYVSMPITGIPDKFDRMPKESRKVAAMKWAKEKGMSESLDKSLTDAVHWVTMSHIGHQGAGQMGLNTFDMVLPDLTPLSCLPAFGLPSLPDQSFLDTPLNMDALELPSLDSGLANVDMAMGLMMPSGLGGMLDMAQGLHNLNLNCADIGIDQLNGDDLATTIADMGFT